MWDGLNIGQFFCELNASYIIGYFDQGVRADWKFNWCWQGPFEAFSDGHQFEGYPDTSGFKPTTKNLLKLSVECELACKATA